MNIYRHESLGSVWEIDQDLHRYRRFPKTEAGRERPEWSDERAGSLQDAVWHDYETWYLRDDGTLVIRLGDGYAVTAPPMYVPITADRLEEIIRRISRGPNV